MRLLLHCILCFFAVLVWGSAMAQSELRHPEWGPNDTIIVSIIKYEGEVLPYKELGMVYVSNLPPDKLAKAIEKYNRCVMRCTLLIPMPVPRGTP